MSGELAWEADGEWDIVYFERNIDHNHIVSQKVTQPRSGVVVNIVLCYVGLRFKHS